MELFTTEVQSQFFKTLTAESQEALDAGTEGITRGFKVHISLPHLAAWRQLPRLLHMQMTNCPAISDMKSLPVATLR